MSFLLPPCPYESGPLKNKLVDVLGVEVRGDNITLELSHVRVAYTNTASQNTPWQTECIPDVLGELKMIEECMITHARAKSWIVKLQEQDTDFASPATQCDLKGHTIIYPQQPDRLASVVLPPVKDTITLPVLVNWQF